MGFSKNEYENKPYKSADYVEGSKSNKLTEADKSVHEMMASEDSSQDTSLAADVGCENLILDANISGTTDDANSADV